jgi:hypothetical protein
MMTIEMKVRETTLYVVTCRIGMSDYETFDYDKARQMQEYALAEIPAAECMDCKAVIPISMVDAPSDVAREYLIGDRVRRMANVCPQTTSLHFPGHRVSREEYTIALLGTHGLLEQEEH